MKLKRVLVASVLITVAGIFFTMVTCAGVFRWVYDLPPNIWLEAEEMVSSKNMVASYLVGFLRSLLFVLVYVWIYKGLPGKGIGKGLNYGFIVWLVGSFSGMITMPFYMAINVVVVVYWILQGLVLNVLNGAIVAAVYKGK